MLSRGEETVLVAPYAAAPPKEESVVPGNLDDIPGGSGSRSAASGFKPTPSATSPSVEAVGAGGSSWSGKATGAAKTTTGLFGGWGRGWGANPEDQEPVSPLAPEPELAPAPASVILKASVADDDWFSADKGNKGNKGAAATTPTAATPAPAPATPAEENYKADDWFSVAKKRNQRKSSAFQWEDTPEEPKAEEPPKEEPKVEETPAPDETPATEEDDWFKHAASKKSRPEPEPVPVPAQPAPEPEKEEKIDDDWFAPAAKKKGKKKK
jgi:hypothetical protein